MNPELFEMSCHFKHETDNAVLIIDPASGEELWIPLSQVEEMHHDKNGDGTIVMSAWIAKKKGLR
jgi:hypothetical protein